MTADPGTAAFFFGSTAFFAAVLGVLRARRRSWSATPSDARGNAS